MKIKTAFVINILIGLCDTITGIMLVAAPVLTLRMMGVSSWPGELVYIQYIGIFVLGLGLSYFIPFLISSDTEKIESIKTTWRFTALARLLVGVFVSYQVIHNGLESAWISVAATDLSLAVFQIILLRTKTIY